MRPFRVYLVALTCATLLLAGLELAPRLPLRQEPGLARLPVLLADIPALPQRARVLGYDRAEFSLGWDRDGACTVREATLLTQLSDASLDPVECEVTGGGWTDPYTGTTQAFDPVEQPVEIDHVLPLSAAWDLGAHSWDPATRRAFANDPVNLLVTSREANRDKSDQLPASWLPPDPGAHCWYSRRVAFVAVRYELPLPQTDLRTMRRTCRMDDWLSGWLG